MDRNDRDNKSKIRSEIAERLSGKTSKEDVNYRPKNHASKESCSECGHYLDSSQDSSSCRRVAGLVYAEDTCDMFVPRTEEKASQDEGQGDRVQPSINIEVILNAASTKKSPGS